MSLLDRLPHHRRRYRVCPRSSPRWHPVRQQSRRLLSSVHLQPADRRPRQRPVRPGRSEEGPPFHARRLHRPLPRRRRTGRLHRHGDRPTATEGVRRTGSSFLEGRPARISGTSDASSGCSPSLAAPMLRSSARPSSMCRCPTAGAGASRWCSTTPSSSPRRAPARSRRSASCSGSLSSRCRRWWTRAAARWPASPGWTSSPRSTRTPSAPTPSATLRLPWTGSSRSPISPMPGASSGCRERWPRWALPACAGTPRPNCRPS